MSLSVELRSPKALLLFLIFQFHCLTSIYSHCSHTFQLCRHCCCCRHHMRRSYFPSQIHKAHTQCVSVFILPVVVFHYQLLDKSKVFIIFNIFLLHSASRVVSTMFGSTPNTSHIRPNRTIPYSRPQWESFRNDVRLLIWSCKNQKEPCTTTVNDNGQQQPRNVFTINLSVVQNKYLSSSSWKNCEANIEVEEQPTNENKNQTM